MVQTKDRKETSPKSRTHTSRRGKTTAKRQSAAQSCTKKTPSKTVLRQMAKDWDHVT